MAKDRSCCVFNCKSDNLRRHLHRFPASEEIRRQWLVAIGDNNLSVLSIKKLKKKFVCSEHFESKYYSREVANKLLNTAVPTVFNYNIRKPLDSTIDPRPSVRNIEHKEPTVAVQNGMKTIVLRDSRYEDITLLVPETFTISVRRCSPSEENAEDWFGSGGVPSGGVERSDGEAGVREILVDDLAPAEAAAETGIIKIVDPTREPIPVPSILDCLDLVPRHGARYRAPPGAGHGARCRAPPGAGHGARCRAPPGAVTVPRDTLLLAVGGERCRRDVPAEYDKDHAHGEIQRVRLNGISDSKSPRIMHNVRWQPDVKLNVQCTVLLPKVEVCVSCDTEYLNDSLHVCRKEKSNDEACELRTNNSPVPRSTNITPIERYAKNAPSLYECELCTEIFESNECLSVHKKRMHDADVAAKSFKCVLCPLAFDECPKLTAHIEKLHIFQCDSCNEIFVDEDGLREHETSDHGKLHDVVAAHESIAGGRPNIGGSNQGRSNFLLQREPVISRRLTLPFCCQESFKFQLSEQNKKVLKASNVYMCHSCSKYMYKCTKCEHIFRTQHGMNIHFNKEHNVKNVKKILPECCNVSFYRHLSSDAVAVSDITGKPIVCDACFENIYNCTVCREIFRTKYRLNKHVFKEHGDAKVEKVKLLFKCSVCLQTFPEQHLLDAHIRHEHRFKCQTCCENFKSNLDLNKHIASVHMSNCVIKPGCKRPAFAQSKSLLKFERPFLLKTHLHGLRVGQFQCFKCTKTCLNEAFLRQHIRDAHSTKRWECVTCRGVFQTEIAVNNHIVDCHCSVPGNKALRKCNLCGRIFENRWSIWGHVALKECNHLRQIAGLADSGSVKREPNRDDGGSVKQEPNQDDGSETNWEANMKIIKIEQIVKEDNCEGGVVEADPLQIKEEPEDMDIGPEVLQYSDQCYSNCVEECAN